MTEISVYVFLPLQVCAIYYMIFTRKGLSHPGSRYGKGFMVALSFMTALHICNIATHVSTPHVTLTWQLLGFAQAATQIGRRALNG